MNSVLVRPEISLSKPIPNRPARTAKVSLRDFGLIWRLGPAFLYPTKICWHVNILANIEKAK